jgi:carboxyl-terminal processing protease
LNFITENKVQISKIGMQDFISHYQVPASLFQEVLRLATREKIKYTSADLKRSTTLINIDLKAYIGRGAWGDKAFYPIFHQQDELFKKALQLFGEAALLK